MLILARYCNIDYVWASTYQHMSKDIPKVVSYDIACQWKPRLMERLSNLPEHVRIEVPEGTLRYAIPKYHFMGHKEKNHHQFSFNMMSGVGRTDGEEIERGWSRHDATSGSVREMGPGSRQDTLEDHFGSANWEKKIGLGSSLLSVVQYDILTLVQVSCWRNVWQRLERTKNYTLNYTKTSRPTYARRTLSCGRMKWRNGRRT